MSRLDRRIVLPNGLPVYGATPADARFQNFIGEYFKPGVDIRPGITVVDVGANVGMFALEVLRRCDGDAHIIAVEPAPETFGYLERNLRELFPRSRAELYQCALGDHEGEVTLYHRPRTATTTSIYPEPLFHPVGYVEGFLREPPTEYRTPVSVWVRRLPRAPVKRLLSFLGRRASAHVVALPCPLTTLSSLLDKHPVDAIDLLKVDVEGAEMDVLRGIRAAHWSLIERLAVEVHDVEGRLDAMRSLLCSVGLGDITLTQDWPFEGTNVYMLHAGRSATSGGVAAGNVAGSRAVSAVPSATGDITP